MTDDLQTIYTVSQLNAKARHLMEQHFHSIMLVGEISNLARPNSGHYYFSLKDNYAQIRCALFCHSQQNLTFKPEAGQQVLVEAKVSLYETRGDFQLIVSHMQLTGTGALQIAFEKLKQKLAAEGLFDELHKQALPHIPRCLGVITSPTGAAIHDILRVLHRRFPVVPVIIYPSAVQGDLAKQQLVSAIETANQHQECDVLILARGGGSLEDLWPFNEEILARALFTSKIPIVTGIGHEVDFTIADFVADQRCATPSAAAEQVSPDITEWQEALNQYQHSLSREMYLQLKRHRQELTHLAKRLKHPGQRLEQQMQTFDQLEQRLTYAIGQQIQQRQERLQLISRHLDAVSPLNTLKRGYAIVTKDHKLVTQAQQVKIEDPLTVRLAKGTLQCVVASTRS